MIDVVFLFERESKDVFAFFPNMEQIENAYNSYSHIGQHSLCHIDYRNECQEADTNSYALTLLPELHRIGYRLNILNKQRIECSRQPTDGEIKRGYGARHYKYFTLSEIGINRRTGEIKTRFKSKDDGLIYSRL